MNIFFAVLTLMLAVLVHPQEFAQSSLRGELDDYEADDDDPWDDEPYENHHCIKVCRDDICHWWCTYEGNQERLDNEKDDGQISYHLRSSTS